MKWIFRTIFLILALFILAGVFGATRPSEVGTEQLKVIDAAPEDIFPYFNNLETHVFWSPWLTGDADIDVVYGGPPNGRGQTMAWRSTNADIGVGTQEIAESQPGSFVRADMQTEKQGLVMTYAVSENDDGDTVALMGAQIDLGGFPFVQRLFAGSRIKALDEKLAAGLDTLERVVTENSGD